MFQIWRQVIPRVDKKFSITDRVCELHFTPDEIIKTYEQKCYDGSLFKLDRGRAKLSTGAIPTIFPKLPEYSHALRKIVEQVRKDVPLFSTFAEVRAQKFIEEELAKYFLKGSQETRVESFEQNVSVAEVDASNEDRDLGATSMFNAEVETNVCDIDTNVCNVKNNLNDATIKTEDENLCDPDSTSENTDMNAEGMHAINVNEYIDDEIEPDEITYEVLLRSLSSISMPGNDWSITEHGDFVMCAKWDENYIPIKRVVIDSNLNTKVSNDYKHLKSTIVLTYVYILWHSF